MSGACKRVFLSNKISFSIIPVDELTIVPIWRTVCKANVIKTIEQSPRHNLYVKMENNVVVGAAKNIIDLITTYEVTVISILAQAKKTRKEVAHVN